MEYYNGTMEYYIEIKWLKIGKKKEKKMILTYYQIIF